MHLHPDPVISSSSLSDNDLVKQVKCFLFFCSCSLKDWLQLSKGLKGNFKTNYTERTCTVREYCQVSQSQDDDSVSSSVTTDQTDCSVTVPEDNCEDQAASRSSSASTIVFQSEEKDQLSD